MKEDTDIITKVKLTNGMYYQVDKEGVTKIELKDIIWVHVYNERGKIISVPVYQVSYIGYAQMV